MGVYINLVGDPSTGFKPIGPFDYGGDAFDAGEEMYPHEQQWVMELNTNHPLKWTNPLVQFARLVDEMQAAIPETAWNDMWVSLRESMDVTEQELEELFERAQTLWDEIKAQLNNKEGADND